MDTKNKVLAEQDAIEEAALAVEMMRSANELRREVRGQEKVIEETLERMQVQISLYLSRHAERIAYMPSITSSVVCELEVVARHLAEGIEQAKALDDCWERLQACDAILEPFEHFKKEDA
jgi:hypothetical protein